MTVTPVLLAIDCRLFRDGLKKIVEQDPCFPVLWECSDIVGIGDSDWREVGIVIFGSLFSADRRLQTAKDVRDRAPNARSVSLGRTTDHPLLVKRLLQVGIDGYLPLDTQGRDLLSILRAAATGQIVVSKKALERGSSFALPSIKPTPREMDILHLVADGYSNKEIAARLAISARTVQFHLTGLFSKAGAASRTHLVGLAQQAGWLGHL